MTDEQVDALQDGGQIVSKKSGKVRTIVSVYRRHHKVRAVLLTKTFKVVPGVLRVGESCVERWALKNTYDVGPQ